MRPSTAYNRQAAAASELRDLYRSARRYGLTHRTIIERGAKIMESVSKCPNYVKAYLHGHNDALWRAMWDDLVFCYRLDGKLYAADERRPDYYGRHGFSPRQCTEDATEQGFFWEINGQFKPFDGQ